MKRNLFITRIGATGFHCLVHVLPSDYSPDRDSFLDIDTLNVLTSWKTLDSLASVLKKTGPFISKPLNQKEPRNIPISEAIQYADSREKGRFSLAFDKNDVRFIQAQSLLNGKECSYPPLASIERFVQDYGLLESKAIEDLRVWEKNDPSCRVILEPLSDVLLCRNIGAILLRLIANLLDQKTDQVLEESGFKNIIIEKKLWSIGQGLKRSYYAMPFIHNVVVDDTVDFSLSDFWNAIQYPQNAPLQRRINKQGKGGCLGLINNASWLSYRFISGKPAPLFGRKSIERLEETQVWLGIDSSKTQEEEARDFIQMATNFFSDFKTDKGIPLGWDVEPLDPLCSEPKPKFKFCSLFGAMIATILYRYGAEPTTCKNCGNGMLVKTKGKRREFCSNTCKTQYSAKS